MSSQSSSPQNENALTASSTNADDHRLESIVSNSVVSGLPTAVDLSIAQLSTGILARRAVPPTGMTMQEEIDSLTEAEAPDYHGPLVRYENVTEPVFHGATEHVTGYTPEQAARFFYMSNILENRSRQPNDLESIMIETVTGHYALFQITQISSSEVTATAVHNEIATEMSSNYKITRTSELLGCDNKSYEPPLGSFLLGDLIAVKQLRRKNVKKFCLFKRHIVEQTFHVGKTGHGVVLGSGVVASPPEGSGITIGASTTYTGHIFYPVVVGGIDPASMTAAPNPQLSIINRDLSQAQILSSKPDAVLTRQAQKFNDNWFDYSPELLNYFVMLGSSAMTAARTGVFDLKKRILTPLVENGLVKFNLVKRDTEKTWFPGVMVETELGFRAKIIQVDPTGCTYTARILDNGNNQAREFRGGLVFQIKQPTTPSLHPGFFDELPEGSNGKRVIKAVFGGLEIGENGEDVERKGYPHTVSNQRMAQTTEPIPIPFEFDTYPFPLTPSQYEYIKRIVDRKLPISVGIFPIHSGKTYSVAIAALQSALARPNTQQLVFVPDDRGARLMVNHLLTLPGIAGMRLVRMISQDDWRNTPEEDRTKWDYPTILNNFLENIVEDNHEDDNQDITMLAEKYLDGQTDATDVQILLQWFLAVPPQIIIAKFEDFFSNPTLLEMINNVSSIQFDTADQAAQIDLVQACVQYPTATFGLMGDSEKDPPVIHSMSAYQAKMAIGQLMKKCVEWIIFPTVYAKEMFSSPAIVKFMKEIFYKNHDFVGVSPQGYYVQSRPDIFPSGYPARILNLDMHKGWRLLDNQVHELAKFLTSLTNPKNGTLQIPTDHIGVICSRSEQVFALNFAIRGSGIQVGLSADFQEIRKEIIIFFLDSLILSRVGIARNELILMMSRAKQGLIIYDFVGDMKKMNGDKKGTTSSSELSNFLEKIKEVRSAQLHH